MVPFSRTPFISYLFHVAIIIIIIIIIVVVIVVVVVIIDMFNVA